MVLNMVTKFKLSIIAIGKVFFDGETNNLVIPTIDGYHGILANHEPMVTAMSPGELRFKNEDGEWRYAAVSEGIVEILPDAVTILADTVERPEDIDIVRAQSEKEHAEDILLHKQSLREHLQAELAISKAMARLSVAGKSKRIRK